MSKSDPRDIDEDAILKGLSAEELEKLEYELQEMDPEVPCYAICNLSATMLCNLKYGLLGIIWVH